MQKKYAIIVAGGTGSRMGNNLPKQFQLLAERPILMHTLAKFAHSANTPELIVVLNASMINYWYDECKRYAFTVKHHIVEGGETRFQSVQNGINYIAEMQPAADSLVAIHDAARPLISSELIDEAYTKTAVLGATVVALASTNSVRYGTEASNKAVDRSHVWIVQTPQTFQWPILSEAFTQEEQPFFTDDASVVEQLDIPIHIVPGEPQNIKITYPEDLKIAEMLLKE